jgi:hypothetical protein
LEEYDHGNQQNPPFSKLHIQLLKEFEDSKTFTNFITPLLLKRGTEQPCINIRLYTAKYNSSQLKYVGGHADSKS